MKRITVLLKKLRKLSKAYQLLREKHDDLFRSNELATYKLRVLSEGYQESKEVREKAWEESLRLKKEIEKLKDAKQRLIRLVSIYDDLLDGAPPQLRKIFKRSDTFSFVETVWKEVIFPELGVQSESGENGVDEQEEKG